MTLEQVAQQYGITLDQAKKLKLAMAMTWDYIGYDYIDCFDSERQAINAHGGEAAMIAEATVDAHRLKQHGDVGWFYDLPGDIIKIAEDVWTTTNW